MPEVVLDVHLRGVDPGHSAAQAAYGELLHGLGDAPALRATERHAADNSGSKGAVSELVLSVTASGSVAGLVKIAQLWLGRDRRRSLRVTVRTSTHETVYDVTGDNISVSTLAEALEAAVQSDAVTGAGQESESTGADDIG